MVVKVGTGSIEQFGMRAVHDATILPVPLYLWVLGACWCALCHLEVELW